jgi:hypothetical protein
MFIFNTIATGEAARAEDLPDITNEEEEHTKDHPVATTEEDVETNTAAATGDVQTKAHPPCHLPGLLIELNKGAEEQKTWQQLITVAPTDDDETP